MTVHKYDACYKKKKKKHQYTNSIYCHPDCDFTDFMQLSMLIFNYSCFLIILRHCDHNYF